MNRYPLLATVSMYRASNALSPSPFRNCAIALVRTFGVTNVACQTTSSNSSFVTSRSRFAIRWRRTSNAFGSSGTIWAARRTSTRRRSTVTSPNSYRSADITTSSSSAAKNITSVRPEPHVTVTTRVRQDAQGGSGKGDNHAIQRRRPAGPRSVDDRHRRPAVETIDGIRLSAVASPIAIWRTCLIREADRLFVRLPGNRGQHVLPVSSPLSNLGWRS
jgi:hypothetical protein